jgi:MYXO-CTERM domain-containing protein
MSARPRWRWFRNEWPGQWFVRWDPRNRTPRFLGAPGVPLTQAHALAADVARLSGVHPDALVGPRITQAGDRTILHWDRRWRGVPVEGDLVGVVAIGTSIAGVWVQLTPIPMSLGPRQDEVIFVTPDKGEPLIARRSREGSHVVYRDRAGDELYRYETRLAATVNVTLEERTIDDPMIEVPARDVRLRDPDDMTHRTDDDGVWDGGEVTQLELNGPTLRVRDDDGTITVPAPDPLPEPWTVEGGVDMPLAAGTVLHHFHVTWDWLADRWPTHAWLDTKMKAKIHESSERCNAWYDGTSITFCQEDPEVCHDFGRIADVVYHELGHAVHHRILATGTFASDISEGSSDYLSATLTDDPVLAPNAMVGGGYVREIATDRSYPEDYTAEVHNDGLIWASFLWNLRTDWMAERGDDAGLDAVDGLFLRTLEQGPSLLDVYEAILVADDDDGDLSDGTPNDCDLMTRLSHHGIGPGPIGVVMFDHTPLSRQASSATSYEVSFELIEATPDCSDLDRDSVVIWTTTSDAAAPGVLTDEMPTDTGLPPPIEDPEDTGFGFASYDAWTRIDPTELGGEWIGDIPRQPATRKVRYFIEAASADGSQIVRTHGGREDGVYAFWIGDRNEIWCEDFETGGADWTHGVGLPDATEIAPEWVSEWSFGTPEGSLWGPDAAASGDTIAATAIDAEYSPNNAQQLRSPAVDLSDTGPMLMLSYKRWLTVEDGIYDQANVYLEDTLLWTNPASPRGTEHVLDEGWTDHDIPLDGLLLTPASTVVTWGLRTDPGLQFGGWQLDDVCFVDLADVPGHYRVRNLEATTDEPAVELTWTHPWVEPLSRTVLVRTTESPPTGPEDGTIIDEDDAPTAGEERVVIDEDITAEVTYYYAVFAAADDADALFTDLVEGENLAIGGYWPAAVDTASDTGSPDPEDTAAPSPDTAAGDDTGSIDTGPDGGADAGPPDGDSAGAPADTGETDRWGPLPATVIKEGCACTVQSGARDGFAVWWLGAMLTLLARRRRSTHKRKKTHAQ